MQISFTQKIPISTCNILNKETQQFERATLYEIDCKDREDIDYLQNAEAWKYGCSIAYDALNKHLDLRYYPQCEESDKYYSLETQNKDMACLCETQPLYGNTNIRYLEANPDKKYKYAGQTMLASIAKLLSKTSQSIQILVPTSEARDFYSKICGFKEDLTGFGYELPQKDMKKFIQGIEKRTCGKIINYQS